MLFGRSGAPAPRTAHAVQPLRLAATRGRPRSLPWRSAASCWPAQCRECWWYASLRLKNSAASWRSGTLRQARTQHKLEIPFPVLSTLASATPGRQLVPLRPATGQAFYTGVSHGLAHFSRSKTSRDTIYFDPHFTRLRDASVPLVFCPHGTQKLGDLPKIIQFNYGGQDLKPDSQVPEHFTTRLSCFPVALDPQVNPLAAWQVGRFSRFYGCYNGGVCAPLLLTTHDY